MQERQRERSEEGEEAEAGEPGREDFNRELVESKLCCSARLNITVIAFLAIFNLSFIRVSISMILVCMTVSEDEEATEKQDLFDWSSTTKGYIISAAFYGFLVGPLLAGFLSYRIGGKLTLLISTFGCSLLHFVLPQTVQITVLFSIVRGVLGLFAGFILPAVYDLFSNWVVPEERQLLVTGSLVAIPLANIASFPVSSFICAYMGWMWLFYVPAIWLAFFGTMCIFVVYNQPEQCPFISQAEVLHIQHQIPPSVRKTIPWTAILKSLPVYAYIFIHFCVNYLYLTLVFSLPTLMKTIHNFSLSENGIFSSLPFISQFITRILMTAFFERLRKRLKLSKNFLRKSFVFLGATLTSMFLLLVVFSSSYRYWVLVCFIMASTSLELCLTGGYLMSLLDLCPRYVNVLTGITNAIANSAGLISPVLNGLMTTHGTVEEWNNVFYVNIAIIMTAMIFYLIFGRNDVQYWALGPELENKDVSRQSLLE